MRTRPRRDPPMGDLGDNRPANGSVNSGPPSGAGARNAPRARRQLRAALRRAPTPEGRPPVTDPLAGQMPGGPVKVPIQAHARRCAT